MDGEGILGGNESKSGQFTYQVSINIYDDSVCGGGIIGDEFIVTAAHCFIDENFKIVNEDPVTVVAGSNDLKWHSDSRVAIKVDTIYLPRDFFKNKIDDPNIIADIAVLKVSKVSKNFVEVVRNYGK